VKLADRCQVEGTGPPIQIGHRVKRYADGSERVSRKWSAQYCVAGRHRYESLGTTNKASAIRKAHEIGQRLARGDERAVSRRIDLDALVKEYLSVQEDRGASPKTLTKYTQVLDELVDWFRERGDGLAGHFSERDFWAFRQWMAKERERTLEPKTIEDRLTIVKQLFKYGVKEKRIDANPLASVSVPAAPGTVQPCVTPEQVATLLAAANATLRPIFTVTRSSPRGKTRTRR
jgi:hypothetical protein